MADFAVVGGGIGGAVFAEIAARGGKRVVVLERSAGPPGWTRPEILWPATVETLRTLAPAEAWREAMLPLDGIDIDDGRGVQPLLSRAILDEAGVQPWSTDPNRTRAILLGLGSCEVRRGFEVASVLKEGERVVGVRGGEHEVRAAWTVGDDGARSIVREACGIPLDARLFPLEFHCFGFAWPASLPPARGRIWPSPATARDGILGVFVLPLPGSKGTGIVLVQTRTFDEARAPEAFARILEREPTIGDVVAGRAFPSGFTRVRRPFGHAAHYGANGAVLLGDAAHPVSPAGGQGANMSVADGRALARAALETPERLVEAYELARRDANERSLGLTRAIARLWSLPTWCRPAALFFAFLGFARRRPALLARALRSASTRFLEDTPPQT